MSPPLRRLLVPLRTLAVAAAGGYLAHLLHVPLAWMIGAMVATAALAWHRPTEAPPALRTAALLVLGLGFGQGFTAPVLGAVIGAAPAILVAGLASILGGLLVARLFLRLARSDPRTAFFASVPGGIIVMAILAEKARVPVAPVTMAQTVRMVTVVLLFPPAISLVAAHAADAAFSAPRLPFDPLGLALLAAGGVLVALAGERLRIANPWMLGPCLLAILLSALAALPSGVPMPLVDLAQVGMGAALGTRLTRQFLLGSRRLAVAAALSTLALALLLAAAGVAIGLVAGLPPAAVALGMAPGGMPEMTVTAKALDLAVPLVLSFHLVRTLMCNLLVEPIWRLALALRLVPPAPPAA
jgi:membrane AbrB-like protein